MWIFIGIAGLIALILITSFMRSGYSEHYKNRTMEEDNHDRDLRVFDKTFRR